MKELGLFDDQSPLDGELGEIGSEERLRLRSPIARNTDPETSHESAKETTRTTRGYHCRILLTAIKTRPGCINAQLAKSVGLSQYETTKRVSDLINAGKAHYGMKNRSEETGRLCATVWPTR